MKTTPKIVLSSVAFAPLRLMAGRAAKQKICTVWLFKFFIWASVLNSGWSLSSLTSENRVYFSMFVPSRIFKLCLSLPSRYFACGWILSLLCLLEQMVLYCQHYSPVGTTLLCNCPGWRLTFSNHHSHNFIMVLISGFKFSSNYYTASYFLMSCMSCFLCII